jgi:transmembrane sensor
MLEKIIKFFSGEITEKEKLQLDEWKKTKENYNSFQKVKNLWKLSEDRKISYQPNLKIGFGKFIDRIKKEQNKQQVGRIIQVRKISYWTAASIILFVSTWFMWKTQYSDKTKYFTDAGQSLSIYLPDSSLIVMNEKSKLSFSKEFKHRKVTLKGEAFFEIVRDTSRQFSVSCENSIVSVLGTSFNVRTSKKQNIDQVHVLTGKVAFIDKKKSDVQVVLHKGNFADLKNHEITESVISDYNFLFYKTRQLDFSNIKLKELAKQLEKYYHEEIKIISPEIKDVEITATYKDMSIDEIMNELEIILNISVQKENTTWILK